jgi:GNAT superfamily N-acetyltransferase/rRNA-processing protein FCF1
VFIAVEPFYGSTEAGLERGATLVRLASEQGHTLFVHPATRDDLYEGKDHDRRRQRLAELQKYPMLAECRITRSLEERAGSSVPGSNDHRDLRLLAALDAHAATYLISEDTRLRRRARRAGLRDATLTVDEAITLLEGLQPKNPTPPPHVIEVPAYTLDTEQDIFDSLRQDYGPNFDIWLDKVRADSENRTCLAVLDDEEDYVALAILKEEKDCAYNFHNPVIKISTFKVAPNHAGAKYGELLLKSIFRIAARKQAATLYVEVFSKHELLVDLLEIFGFQESPHQTSRNELVLAKSLIRPADNSEYSSLDYHMLFGPPAIKTTERSFVVPIIPQWHNMLFPDSPAGPPYSQMPLPGMSIASENHPSGNALRKAYLCNSNIGSLEPGDILLFYRSRDLKAVTTIGIVESVIRSADPQEIMTYVGRRTVYRPDEIVTMCRSVRGVLAILFRQDRFIEPPWHLDELQENGVLRGSPQTIVTVGEKGCTWIHHQLDE